MGVDVLKTHHSPDLTDAARRAATAPRCTFCPAGCCFELRPAGPDHWRLEPPTQWTGGLCPRGAMLGELLTHRNRILACAQRTTSGVTPMSFEKAMHAVIDAARDRIVMFVLDANLPIEQLAESVAWCGASDRATACFAIEPAEHEMLLGVEAGGAEYLSHHQLGTCDGYLIIGDALAANPTCAARLFDQRAQLKKLPIVAVDPAGGIASRFATHSAATTPGEELAVLTTIAESAAAARAQEAGRLGDPRHNGSGVISECISQCGIQPEIEQRAAEDAGHALAGCERLGVLIAAEYGRTRAWRQIGYLASTLARSFGGGVAPQTSGANTLAAVRLAHTLKTCSLAEAISRNDVVLFDLGADVLGVLGEEELDIAAAAAALPSATTNHARIVTPLPLPIEMSGTWVTQHHEPRWLDAPVEPPRGVPTPAQYVEHLVRTLGVTMPAELPMWTPVQRCVVDPPPPATPAHMDINDGDAVLLLARQPMHAGTGALTQHGSWGDSNATHPVLRMGRDTAHELGVIDRSPVTIRRDDAQVCCTARITPELHGRTVVLGEALPAARTLFDSTIDSAAGVISAEPIGVTLERAEG